MNGIFPIITAAFILLILYARKKTDVLAAFSSGVKDGIKTLKGIFPTLLFILPVLSAVRLSGFTDFLSECLLPLSKMINIPAEIVPLALLRPISGSGALAMLSDILKNCGADSYPGFLACVLSASTETTLYTISVYLGGKSKHCGKIIFAALLLDFITLLTAAVLSPLFY